MTYELTLFQIWSIIGLSVFFGMAIGVTLMCILSAGRSEDAFLEE